MVRKSQSALSDRLESPYSAYGVGLIGFVSDHITSKAPLSFLVLRDLS